ncbi:hypothetical protein BH24CHL7_BH24CHL7_10390 [soil metagenome]
MQPICQVTLLRGQRVDLLTLRGEPIQPRTGRVCLNARATRLSPQLERQNEHQQQRQQRNDQGADGNWGEHFIGHVDLHRRAAGRIVAAGPDADARLPA